MRQSTLHSVNHHILQFFSADKQRHPREGTLLKRYCTISGGKRLLIVLSILLINFSADVHSCTLHVRLRSGDHLTLS